MLILLSFSMLFGSYFAGIIPLVFNFSEEKIRLLTILGSGILVGTALSVIIPEGVNTLYTSHEFHHHLQSATVNPKIDNVNLSSIGLTLIIGFVFMLFVDQIAYRHSLKYSNIPNDNVENGELPPCSFLSNHKQSSKITTTLGLVVHSAADGIALGAAATTSKTDVEMIVFLAIMLHKAPAAFGLVTFLMHKGLDHHRLRKHLIFFSLAAPIGALLTFFFIGQSAHETLSNYNATGLAMLFSAGTFLYVATVHVLPEIISHQALKLTELLTLVVGSFLPSFMTVNHRH